MIEREDGRVSVISWESEKEKDFVFLEKEREVEAVLVLERDFVRVLVGGFVAERVKVRVFVFVSLERE